MANNPEKNIIFPCRVGFFQFLVSLVKAITAAKLKIAEPFAVVELTAQIHDADVARDHAFRGMVNYVKGLTAAAKLSSSKM